MLEEGERESCGVLLLANEYSCTWENQGVKKITKKV
jgi:hypothetical protein